MSILKLFVLGIAVTAFVFSCIQLSSALLNPGIRVYFNFSSTAGEETDNVFQTTNITYLDYVVRGATGKSGNSFLYNGTTGSFVNGTNMTNFNSTKGTMAMWLKWEAEGEDADGYSIPFGFENDVAHAQNFFYIQITNTTGAGATGNFIKMQMRANNKIIYTFNTTAGTLKNLTKNQWVHFAVVQNGTKLQVYLNGTAITGDYEKTTEEVNKTFWFDDLVNQVTSPANTFSFGGMHGQNVWYNGSIDEFGYWNTALTQADVTQLYLLGAGNFYPFTESQALAITLNSPANGADVITVPAIFNASYVVSEFQNLTNTTFWIYNNDGTVFSNTGYNTTSGTSNTTTYATTLVPASYSWNVYACAVNDTGTSCGFASTNNSFNYGFTNVTSALEDMVYETDLQYYNVTLNSTGVPQGWLWWNGTKYAGVTSVVGADKYLVSYSLDVPAAIGKKGIFWEILLGSLDYNTSVQNQYVNNTNLTACESGGVKYINYTFKNETVSQEITKAYVTESVFNYYLGSGSVYKTLTYANATENFNYTFCFTPKYKPIKVNVSMSYTNAESQQRIYNPGLVTYTNATTESTLWLLPTSDGIFVTFQVVNVARQMIAGALITIFKSGYGTITQQVTGASGTVTIFLNPNLAYTLTAASGTLPAYSTTQIFALTEYTITLGTEPTTDIDYTTGIAMQILPKSQVLKNQTDYMFNYTISSGYWSLDNFGFTLYNESGGVLGANSSTLTTGGMLSYLLNTGTNNSKIIMEYYYVINSSYQNYTASWNVRDYRSGSISGFFTRLATYLKSHGDTGFYGITPFTLAIFIFFAIFGLMGILSFKYGFTSPIAISIIPLVALILLEGYGILPNPLPEPLSGFEYPISTIAGLIFMVMIWRELQ